MFIQGGQILKLNCVITAQLSEYITNHETKHLMWVNLVVNKLLNYE